jgi:hypothetical protein
MRDGDQNADTHNDMNDPPNPHDVIPKHRHPTLSPPGQVLGSLGTKDGLPCFWYVAQSITTEPSESLSRGIKILRP